MNNVTQFVWNLQSVAVSWGMQYLLWCDLDEEVCPGAVVD